MRGYRAPTPAQSAGAQPTAWCAGSRCCAPPRAQQTPTATDVVASIQRGQPAAQSLSNAGGTSVDTQLTPAALAEMSDAQFEKLYNEVMASGDKKKLMDLFGH